MNYSIVDVRHKTKTSERSILNTSLSRRVIKPTNAHARVWARRKFSALKTINFKRGSAAVVIRMGRIGGGNRERRARNTTRTAQTRRRSFVRETTHRLTEREKRPDDEVAHDHRRYRETTRWPCTLFFILAFWRHTHIHIHTHTHTLIHIHARACASRHGATSWSAEKRRKKQPKTVEKPIDRRPPAIIIIMTTAQWHRRCVSSRTRNSRAHSEANRPRGRARSAAGHGAYATSRYSHFPRTVLAYSRRHAIARWAVRRPAGSRAVFRRWAKTISENRERL